ncbi:MAG: hypothetical protein EXS05_11310 [Planctomycetaceae bacterium]|nr:hypothetical protein [Planctomycetaceae bacterium]
MIFTTIYGPVPFAVWEITVKCTDEYVPHHMQPASLIGPPIATSTGWRALAGQQFDLQFIDHEPFPTNPGNIYVGWHEFPNDHLIRFVRRQGTSFLITWSCRVRATDHSPEHPISVSSEFDFRELWVWSDKPVSYKRASQLALRYFDLDDLGDPRQEQILNVTRFCFPIIATS